MIGFVFILLHEITPPPAKKKKDNAKQQFSRHYILGNKDIDPGEIENKQDEPSEYPQLIFQQFH